MTPLVAYLLLFIAVGIGFIFVHLVAGKLLRPNKPSAEKQTIYECGEPTIGSAWIQFDLRFYVVALLFVIFDVEVAFFFPWAEVFGKANNFAADTVMPSDYDTMKAYSVRVAELGPDVAGESPGRASSTPRFAQRRRHGAAKGHRRRDPERGVGPRGTRVRSPHGPQVTGELAEYPGERGHPAREPGHPRPGT